MGGQLPIFFIQIAPTQSGTAERIPLRGQNCIKKRAGTESNLLFSSTNTKGVFFVRIFQRISIGVRVATQPFSYHSEQVVSISALCTSLYRGQRQSLRMSARQDITKSRKILFRYYELFTSHLSNSSERFLLFFNYQKANN